MKTITAVKVNGTIWYLWREKEGVFISCTEGVILAFAHELEDPKLQAKIKRNPHDYSFWRVDEIKEKHSGSQPLRFPVFYDDPLRLFELIADNTTDFSWDNDFWLSMSPAFQWVFLFDLDDNTFRVYGGHELLVDRTLHRNYDIKLELGCDDVPCFMAESWMLDDLPEIQTLRNTCSASSLD